MAKLPLNLHSYEHGGIAPPAAGITAPAMTALPLLRYPLGYETVHPWPMLRRIAVFAVIPPLFWFVWQLFTGMQLPANEGPEYFYLALAASFAMTCARFIRRAWGQHRGEEIHTAEAGYSLPAQWLPIPAALVEQLLVPTALIYGGLTVAFGFSIDLGCWLIVCGVSYFVLANWERRNLLAQRRAPVDDKIRSQGFVETIDRHERKLTQRAARRKQHGQLYPDGAEPDIAELGHGRRR